MIIVTLEGGLGNQLFQYAAGRALAERHGSALRLDITPFADYRLHDYALTPFRIREAFASAGELAAITGRDRQGIDRWLFRIGQRLRPVHRRAILRESHFQPFNPSVLESSANVCLQGYWQSEKYFAEIEDLLREELEIRPEPDAGNAEMAREIRASDSVGVHVRRGDYVSHEATGRIHGVMGASYYQRGTESLRAQVSSPHYFVFSDDPDWARQNLELDGATTFVAHNGPERNYEDLRLMSLCRHNIIANSTFSWWAAWLNRNPEKTVVAPARWFQDQALDTRDLFPEGWIQV